MVHYDVHLHAKGISVISGYLSKVLIVPVLFFIDGFSWNNVTNMVTDYFAICSLICLFVLVAYIANNMNPDQTALLI